MPKTDGSMVQSVERALSLLDLIADRPEAGLTLTELAAMMDLDKSSVFRILATLSHHGLVRQEDDRKTYRLGYGIFTLAGALREQVKLTELASPYLRRLAAMTKENAHLAVRSGLKAVFIDRERAAKTISANTDIGDTEELHCTAVGKCLICGMDRDRLKDLFDGAELARYTDTTITDLDALADEVALTASRGYGLDLGEYESRVTCLAAPVYGFSGTVEAAIGISGPSERIDPELDAVIAAVKAVGEELSEGLGYKARKRVPTGGVE